jgi:glutamate synthase (NADPH/NADH) small chain
MDQTGLHELEEQCIQEHNPACMATCPARVDVRGICSEIIKHDFSAALKIYRKSIPFPGIICRICDQPCRNACVRKDAGEAIAIRSLEKACVDFGIKSNLSPNLPHRDNHLAVIGAGLFSLTAAYDLARKGYQVTIFEKSSSSGGSLRTIDEKTLPTDVIQNELSFLVDLGIRFKFDSLVEKITPTDESKFNVLNSVFDAVLIGTGTNSNLFAGIDRDNDGFLIDPLTYETSLSGAFSGGGAASWRTNNLRQGLDSYIYVLADGHRVATSLDRFFQRVSLSAARIKEGGYETRLYTSLEGITPENAIKPAGSSYSEDEAKTEASRCLLCQCLECVKVCEYLKEYGSYPKRYVREIYNNLSIVKGERRKNQFINSCSLCGLCGEVCPTDLNMGTVCRESRREMVNQNRMPPSAHDFALRDMQFSNSNHFSLFRNQPGKTTSKYLFFPGCQLSASNPEYIEKLYSLLRENQELNNDGIGLALRCCGAPARWAGRDDLFQQSREEFLNEYLSLDKPEVILACSSCYQVFKEEYPEISIVSLWDVLDSSSLIKSNPNTAINLSLSIHDPCSTRYETSIHRSSRHIIETLGFKVEELPLNRERTECCSYGGLMWLANRELARKVVDRRINQSENAYVTYCAMCRDFFNRQGKTTYHILDLLFSKGNILPQPDPPDYSIRHTNRIGLKKSLLRNIWKEDMEPSENIFPYKINISQEVHRIMEERLILEEDIQRVLDHAEKSGMLLVNKSNGHLLAYHCPAYVTYWVEFTRENEVFTIHNTYSHRMKIDEGVKS